jgi:hypothetical protein
VEDVRLLGHPFLLTGGKSQEHGVPEILRDHKKGKSVCLRKGYRFGVAGIDSDIDERGTGCSSWRDRKGMRIQTG